ncbi:unnamed protein product [Orchesella dallaii]|uniref:Uncharacterized protein n=1 Tax=Orchesella dallaii TaxID=48710 RepID=A0ABP1SAQ4_9HEXA
MPFDNTNFANVRLVCKLWFQESLSIWRKNAMISVIDDGKKWKLKIKAITNKNYLQVQLYESENDEYQLKKYPFRKFAIKRCIISFDKRDDPVGFEFWHKIGPLMTTLLIQDSGFYQRRAFRQIILHLTPNVESLTLRLNSNLYNENESKDPNVGMELKIPDFPQKNLKQIEIEFDPEDHSELWLSPELNESVWYSEILPISWVELLLQFPMIKHMKLICTPCYEQLLVFLDYIQQIRVRFDVPQYLSCLNKLDIQNAGKWHAFEFPTNIVTSFHRVKLPLTKFSFEIGSKTVIRTFMCLLEAHANTVEELEVSRGEKGFQVLTFPFDVTFGALTKFEVVGSWIGNLNFLSHMPNLKILSLCSGRDEIFDPRKLSAKWKRDSKSLPQIVGKTKLEKLSDSGVVFPSLEKFINVEELCDGSQIRLLSKLMPNLKHFRAGLGTEGFRMVCKVWKKMEHLEIRPFKVDEGGLLGAVSREENYYHHPNITDLTELKSFKIGYVDLRKSNMKYNLSTASIINGVLLLKNLKHIDACLSKKITGEVRTRLLDKFPQGDNQLFVI